MIGAFAMEVHRARIRALQPGDDPQHRALAAARGAEASDQLAGADVETNVIDGQMATESLDQITDLDAPGISLSVPGRAGA